MVSRILSGEGSLRNAALHSMALHYDLYIEHADLAVIVDVDREMGPSQIAILMYAAVLPGPGRLCVCLKDCKR